MAKSKIVTVALAALVAVSALSGCGSGVDNNAAKLTEAGIQEVSELASLKCYYHNVAKVTHDADEGLVGFLLKHGYKKQWIEFDGTVEIGFSVAGVSLDVKNERDVGDGKKEADVFIYLPEPQVLGDPNVVDDTFDESLSEAGFLTEITLEEKTEAVEEAKADMKERAAADSNLMHEAAEHAKQLLRNYVEGIGSATNTTYHVDIQVGSKD